MVQWNPGLYFKGNDPIGNTPHFSRFHMIMGGLG